MSNKPDLAAVIANEQANAFHEQSENALSSEWRKTALWLGNCWMKLSIGLYTRKITELNGSSIISPATLELWRELPDLAESAL